MLHGGNQSWSVVALPGSATRCQVVLHASRYDHRGVPHSTMVKRAVTGRHEVALKVKRVKLIQAFPIFLPWRSIR